MRFFLLCLVSLLLWSQPAQALKDHWGRSLKIANPQRIISLSPATTEMLYAIGAQSRLVGVTEDCDYPSTAQQKIRLGKFGQVPLERILKLKPDLILVTADMGKVLQPLKQLPVPVVALQTPTVAAIEQHLLALGQLTSHQQQAQQQIQTIKSALKALKTWPQKQRKKVFYLVWDQPLMTSSNSSFIGDVLRLAGAENIVGAQQAPFLHYSLETLLKKNPDVLILPRSVAARVNLERPPYNRLKAWKQKRVLIIEDDLISRPGPRVVQAITQINHYLAKLK